MRQHEEAFMNRFKIGMLALALSVASVACGGSQTPANDPSTASDPNAAKAAPSAPPPAAPGLGLGGTGTGSAQGSGNMGH
jgi:hypothetical protein